MNNQHILVKNSYFDFNQIDNLANAFAGLGMTTKETDERLKTLGAGVKIVIDEEYGGIENFMAEINKIILIKKLLK